MHNQKNHTSKSNTPQALLLLRHFHPVNVPHVPSTNRASRELLPTTFAFKMPQSLVHRPLVFLQRGLPHQNFVANVTFEFERFQVHHFDVFPKQIRETELFRALLTWMVVDAQMYGLDVTGARR